MTVGTRLVTAEDLWAMPNNARRELVRGEVRVMAPGGFEHGAIGMNLGRVLGNHVARQRLGVVLSADTGFVLSRNPDSVRAPDVAFVAAARIPTSGLPVTFWEGAPDLAVEVVSPGDTLEEVEEKVDDYLDAGTRMVLVVNPKRRTVTVHRPGAQPVILRQTETIDGGDVVPGFSLPMADVFA